MTSTVPELELGVTVRRPATLFDRVKAVTSFKNVRILYRLPYFSTRSKVCPICRSPEHEYEAQNRYFAIDRCKSCGHCFARRMPGRRILEQTYCTFYNWEDDKHHQGIPEIEYSPKWDKFLADRMSVLHRSGLLASDGQSQDIFEIGCSEGMLLHKLGQMGHNTLGSEMNPIIAQEGMRKLGVQILSEPFEDLDLPAEHFDMVISFHTLEHMCDPHQVFRRIHYLLKPGGGLVIEVPCGPEEYKNTDHVQFFEEESLHVLIGHYFHETRIQCNEYENADGVRIGSLYGIDRRPKSLN